MTGLNSTRQWAVSLFILLSLIGCSKDNPAHTSLIYAFGTMIELTVLGVDNQKAQEVENAIAEDFARMHRDWHAWENGPLGQTNDAIAAGKAIEAHPMILPLLSKGQELAEKSQHLFNPAIGKLIALWGFHGDPNKPRTPPEQAEIEKLLDANPRMSDLTLNNDQLTSNNPSVKLDFGAFGKGYGIDLAIEHLKQLGVKDAIINAGGDLRAIGSRGGLPWRIAVRSPSGHGVFAMLHVSGDESVFTSGDYERHFQHEGKNYHHIIDPRTGFPAEGTKSVTVIHPNATVADAAATALFIAGPDKWQEIAASLGINVVLLVDSEDNIHMTPAMAERIQFMEDDLNIIQGAPQQATGTEENG